MDGESGYIYILEWRICKSTKSIKKMYSRAKLGCAGHIKLYTATCPDI